MDRFNIIKYFKSWIPTQALGYKVPTITTVTKTSELIPLDKNKIMTLLITETIQKLLAILQQELHAEYLKLRDLENKTTAHTPKHTAIVNKMHAITEDLKIIKDHQNMTKMENTSVLTELKKQLNLTSQYHTHER